MNTKHILGLDLGTNSIGWAVVNAKEQNAPDGTVKQSLQPVSIYKAGSRIIPMDAALMGDFDAGNSISQTGERTRSRAARRLLERQLLRRERLNRVLRILGYLPEHYASCLNEYGQIRKGEEPKLAWRKSNHGYEFLFMSSFEEMCTEFRNANPELLSDNKRIPMDWTIYYLRKKALTSPISKQELAWVLHQFNQKRGYNQARGDEEETNPEERKEFMSLRVISVRNTGEVGKGGTWYEIELENGLRYRRQSLYPLEWEGKVKKLIVTTKLNADGTEKTDKEGNVMRSISMPSEDDWGLRKIKTEQDITTSGKTVGEFIYDALLQNPDQKIIGQLVRTVDRKYYRDELYRIIRAQMKWHPELQDRTLYQQCIEALYITNEPYRQSIANQNFDYLLVDNILFYQRPLKSKKSLINECKYEYRTYKDKDGNLQTQWLKCIPKSHPLYEEFRIWQWVSNLSLYRTDGLKQTECTAEYIGDKSALVKWLFTQKEVSQKSLLEHIVGKKHTGITWNYVEDKTYPMAPTTALLYPYLYSERESVEHFREKVVKVWHILYSVTDPKELERALRHYAYKQGLAEEFVEKLKKQKPFENAYGAYSEHAVRKLLSLMRCGAYWNEEAICSSVRDRINLLLTGEDDAKMPNVVRDKCATLHDITDFQGLPLWMAEYVIYRSSNETSKWESPDDIDRYLHDFRQHSLNNPIVEQVVLETLRTVRDIWREVGTIDEIHLEMGRNLKQNAAQRKTTLARQMNNEKANLRAKMLLTYFLNPELDVEGVRPYSPSQLELFRLYEEGVLLANKTDDEIQRIMDTLSSMKRPTMQEVKKYRMWLDQKYVSPYTGQPIPLSQLFTSAYQIEHIIPQSRYFDDSMSNKVICEAEVNALKDKQLAHEFIASHGGEKVTLSGGRVVTILTKEDYEEHVKSYFAGNRGKMERLLMDDIPERFIERQMNDSRYISVLVKGLLSNIVRAYDPITHEYEPEQTSKNLIVCNGTTTDRLKKDWGVNDVWNHIILPRFERLNDIQGKTVFTSTTANGHTVPAMPLELSSGFQKKRIDHRHHAMDAIVIACTTRNHVSLLSNESSLPGQNGNRIALSNLLRHRNAVTYKGGQHTVYGDFYKPWDTFTQDVECTLRDIIVSFKQNLRVINKSSNYYTHFENGKKMLIPQTKGDNWSIRKSMHKDSVFGLVNLRFTKPVNLKTAMADVHNIMNRDFRLKLQELIETGFNYKQITDYFETEKDTWQDIDLKHIEVYYFTNDTNDRYYAIRTILDTSFNEKTIEKITDTGIQRILLAHLAANNNDPKQAFSPEGIEQMNANIAALNGGAPHKPIYKVRKYEKAEKFAVGQCGNKRTKFVENDKGTNLFYLIYETIVSNDEEGKKYNTQTKRSYVTVPFRMAMAAQKEGKREWKPVLDIMVHEQGWVAEEAQLRYILSPGDLVYVPTAEEKAPGDFLWHKERIYKMVSSSGKQCFFLPYAVASPIPSPIPDKKEFSSQNKMERALTGEMIKESCIPIRIDRLGNMINTEI